MKIQKLHSLFLNSSGVATDTRNIKKKSIFFALKGEAFNGNKFAQEALEKGAEYAVVDEKEYCTSDHILQVDDVLSTLQDLAKFHREFLDIPVLAITGSNGKTTTKELVKSVLSQKFTVFATHGNLNNHIGVPLSLLSLNKTHEFAVIEMGASHQKEIEQLCEIALPNYGLITNIGKAHLEGFGGEEGVFKGKTEMFQFLQKKNGTIFLNTDDPKLIRFKGEKNVIEYGKKGKDVSGKKINNSSFLELSYQVHNEEHVVKSNLLGDYNFSNILTAITVGYYFKVTPAQIAKGIQDYIPQNNRSQIIEFSNCKVIMDAYNANPSSVHGALENLCKMEGSNKLAIIGDMLELGDHSTEEHKNVVQLLNKFGINAFLVGAEFKKVNQSDYKVFDNAEQAGEALKKYDVTNHILLFKGSRGIKLENAFNQLKEKLHQ